MKSNAIEWLKALAAHSFDGRPKNTLFLRKVADVVADEVRSLETELKELREALEPMAFAVRLEDADHMTEYMEGQDWDKLVAVLERFA